MDKDYRAYGAVGARKTPQHMLTIASHLAMFLSQNGWTMRSGAGDGFDKTVEAAVDATGGTKEIYLPWRGFNNHASGYDPVNMPFTDSEKEFAAQFHPNWDACGPSDRLFHQRNGRIVVGHPDIHGPEVVPIKFLLAWSPMGQAVGGTGQALRICDGCEIPIINLGVAQNNHELEQLVLKVEEYNSAFK